MKNYLITLSEKILLKAQINEDSVSLRRELFYVKQKNLEVNLITDDLRKAFWINIYNAYVLILANETKQQKKLFKQKRIKIARNRLSLNDVEYGILKRYKFKIGSIYIYDPFYSKFIKNIAINQVDVNLHLRLDSNAVMDI